MATNGIPQDASTPKAAASRRERLPRPTEPGEPFGEALNELFQLAAVARLYADFGGNTDPHTAMVTAEHLADRLAAIASTLSEQELRYAKRPDCNA